MIDPAFYYADPRIGRLIVQACRHRYVALRGQDGTIHRHFGEKALKAIWQYDLRLWNPVVDSPFIEIHRHEGLSDPRSVTWAVQNDRIIEFIPEMSTLRDSNITPYVCVDLDPKTEIQIGTLISLTKLIAAQTAPGGPLSSILPVIGQKIRYSGNRSLHVWSALQKCVPFDVIRAALRKVLDPVVAIMPILSFDVTRQDGVYVDIQINAKGKAVRCLYSLHHKTGLACINVPSLESFDIRHADPTFVLANGLIRESF